MEEEKIPQTDLPAEAEPEKEAVRAEVLEIISSLKENPENLEASQTKRDDEEKPAEVPKSKNSGKKTALTYLHDFVYLLAVVLMIFLLCLRVVVVSGPSMMDTLVDGDYLLLINGTFFDSYKYGDVIIASKDSYRDGEPIVKRVIATEGQMVDIDFSTGIVKVDGVILNEPYIRTSTNLDEGVTFPLIVKEGHIFVMGDNRNDSKDSRSPEIGQIDCREVLGKAIFLLLPGNSGGTQDFNRVGVIG